MKKILALTLVLVMVLALCACGGGSKGAVGTWEIKSMSNGSITYTVDDTPALKGYIVIVLREGGTGTYTIEGESESVTWDSSTITIEGESVDYSVSGNTLTLTSGEYTFKFSRK